MSSLWQNYLDLRHVREQNQELQKTIDRLRLEQAALLEDAQPGPAAAGADGLPAEVHLQDAGRAGHRLQRQRSVAGLLYRQGLRGRPGAATWR